MRYADQWWNSKNPAYPLIKDDCTSYVSQCMHQGGVPLTGIPNRGSGWWYQSNNWSYSWSVANSLRWYLSRSNNVMRAMEVEKPELLVPGDVICYDFQGDGKWDHNVFVTEKDANNSRLSMRILIMPAIVIGIMSTRRPGQKRFNINFFTLLTTNS
ncbi:amidase domain-containing protein [Terrilactibacillus sp. S3-3]|nr:amidase domain-containing protein [Terrilactibacillus sp. S3-3]